MCRSAQFVKRQHFAGVLRASVAVLAPQQDKHGGEARGVDQPHRAPAEGLRDHPTTWGPDQRRFGLHRHGHRSGARQTWSTCSPSTPTSRSQLLKYSPPAPGPRQRDLGSSTSRFLRSGEAEVFRSSRASTPSPAQAHVPASHLPTLKDEERLQRRTHPRVDLDRWQTDVTAWRAARVAH